MTCVRAKGSKRVGTRSPCADAAWSPPPSLWGHLGGRGPRAPDAASPPPPPSSPPASPTDPAAAGAELVSAAEGRAPRRPGARPPHAPPFPSVPALTRRRHRTCASCSPRERESGSGSGSPGGRRASRRRLGLRNRRRRGPPGWQAATGLFNPTASRRGGGGRGSPRPCWGRGAPASGHRASVSGGRDSAVSSPPPPRLRPVPPASRAEGAGGVRVLRPAARGPHMSHKVSTAHYAESANCPFST